MPMHSREKLKTSIRYRISECHNNSLVVAHECVVQIVQYHDHGIPFPRLLPSLAYRSAHLTIKVASFKFRGEPDI